MFSNFKKNVFLQYICSYGIVLLMAIMVAAFFGVRDLSQRQNKAKELSQQAMEQSVDHLEKMFSDLFNLVQVISTSANIDQIQNNPTYYNYYQLYHYLEQQKNLNGMIENIYVMMPQNHCVVGSDGVISNEDYFYRIKYDTKQQKGKIWLQDIENGNLQMDQVRVGYDNHPVALYTQPIMVNNFTQEFGRVLVYLDKEQMRSMITNQSEMEYFSVSINNQTTEIINRTKDSSQSEDELVELEIVSDTGKYYHCIFLENAILQGWNRQLLLNIFLTALVGILGGVLCFYFARWNSTPITEMINLLSGEGKGDYDGKEGIFTYIQGSMKNLINDREFLDAELKRRIPLLQVAFAERLLSGTLIDYTDLKQQMKDLQIHLQGNYFCVAVFQIISSNSEWKENNPNITAVSVFVEHIVEQLADGKSFCYTMASGRISIIFGLEQMDSSFAEQSCHKIVDRLQKKGIHVQSAIGSSYASIADVFLSFTQAQKLLDTLPIEENDAVVLYSQWKKRTAYYYFPAELEMKLIRTALSGNSRMINEVFEELFQENLENTQLSAVMYRRLMDELEGAYLKVLSELQERGLSTEYLDEKFCNRPVRDPSEDEFKLMKSLFLEVCEMIHFSKNHRTEKQTGRIQEYMSAHFSDINFNLAMISDEFGVSEVYMSRMIKESLGMTFTQYLEQIRMECAQKQLLESKKSINDISLSCGYASPHAFRRAYKRYYGNLPSDQRKSIKF